jgi:hypothetical protein
MAATAVTPVAIELNGVTMSSGSAAAVTFTTGNTTDGNAVDFSKADNKTVILFNNTAQSAGKATIKAGDFIQGVTDIEVDVPSGISACVLDSGYFENKTKKVLVVPSAATVTVGAVTLP